MVEKFGFGLKFGLFSREVRGLTPPSIFSNLLIGVCSLIECLTCTSPWSETNERWWVRGEKSASWCHNVRMLLKENCYGLELMYILTSSITKYMIRKLQKRTRFYSHDCSHHVLLTACKIVKFLWDWTGKFASLVLCITRPCSMMSPRLWSCPL